MAKLSTSGVVRDILTSNPEMPTDEVIRRAKAKGLKVADKVIRHSVHNLRNAVRAQVAGTTKVVPAAAHKTTSAKAAPVVAAPVSVTPAKAPTTPDLGGMLENVALVNTIVGLCGGVENVRRTAEAVVVCGGVEAFLQHLELVATIRTSEPTS